MSEEMTSNRPYLLRALYAWISDNSMTPHILVDAGFEGVKVPEQAVQKGKVILNIDEAAVNELELGNEWLTFTARFSGKKHHVSVPLDAVLAIYSKENGQGMMFALDDEPITPTDPDDVPEKTPRKSHLTIVR